ncbi:large subunit GTPase 1 homolog [Panonychus citri]|uniref:large subunit GTPase 1 homolog n=1 Tax=Panonychus citri TaxID=50023 RepID=UPI00230802B9|nr:large subunit GTPase 1 homolog [Panonychus citri]
MPGGKKQFEKSGLGKSLVNKNKTSGIKKSSRHTAVLNDGSDYGKINLRSVTQETSLDDFITIAQMAGDEFEKDHENVTIITRATVQGVLSEEEKRALIKEQEENEEMICIPRRPKWNSDMSSEDLLKKENESFLEWRRRLAIFQEETKLTLTPFEKNVEFWRQLWRVVERSDVLIQILDARNPLLFLSRDLQKYVKEIDPNKMNLIILNKADLLEEKQRIAWAEYFEKVGIRAVFFSALQESVADETLSEEDESKDNDEDAGFTSTDESSDEESFANSEPIEVIDLREAEEQETPTNSISEEPENVASSTSTQPCEPNKNSEEDVQTLGRLLNREELIEYFKTVYPSDRPKFKDEYLTVGFVGYPNVGKSSTINSLIKCKKVSVSATPGKTKHFQTLFLEDDLCLCDCPGLVFPNFASSKAEMILNGILPIDHMNNHVPPVNLLVSLIPAYVFEVKYSITLPMEVHKGVQLTAEQLLNAYGYLRGFMNQRGLPDNPRAARYILKDFVNGKLIYCVAPPGVDQNEFHQFTNHHRPRPGHITLRQHFLLDSKAHNVKCFDSNYFSTTGSTVHAKGPANVINFSRVGKIGPVQGGNSNQPTINKPWRQVSKRNTKQKLRKAFAHLDVK